MLEYAAGQLQFIDTKIPLQNFLRSYKGPIYLYDLNLIKRRYQELKAALGHSVGIFYAIKANANKELVQSLVQLGAGVDVVSEGELKRALECGASAQSIIFSGVGKSYRELSLAVDLGIKQVNVESVNELQRLLQIAQEKNKKVALALRINPEVDAKTHPYIATGLKENKFGIDLASLEDCRKILLKNKNHLQFQGFSVHIGSQILDVSVYREAYEKLKASMHLWEQDFGPLPTVDLGGGLGIFYDRFDFAEEQKLAKEWGQIVHEVFCDYAGEILVEPGRWLVAHAGLLLTRVEYVKQNDLQHFVILDTGMHHLIRPALYQAVHRVMPLALKGSELAEKPPKQLVQLVGPICESSDFIGRSLVLDGPLVSGDFLAILDAGAYGYSMASHYNLREFPEEVCFP